MKKLMLSLALLAMACVAGANTFTADGTVFEPAYGYTFMSDRALVPDGDFEAGSCLTAPTWVCTTDNACDWIADLVPLGLWNYSGAHIAWLGGYCGNLATCTTTICKPIDFGGGANCFVTWRWMGYINNGNVMNIFVNVDATTVFTFIPQLSDHLLDYQVHSADVSAFTGLHTLCFGMTDPQCAANIGDNYFMDYVEFINPTAAEAASVSTVKALY